MKFAVVQVVACPASEPEPSGTRLPVVTEYDGSE
jgi:hypothetical protein